MRFGRALVLLMLMTLLPAAHAADVGSGVGINMETEKFPPSVWICDHRIVLDDNVEPGRVTAGGTELIERIENYAFEGEQIQWEVLVLDKNGIEKVKDVYMTIGAKQSGHLERFCVLPNKNIVVDGTVSENDYDKVFSVPTNANGCGYDVYVANDYHNLFVGFVKKVNCTPQNIFEMQMNTSTGIVNVLGAATQQASSNDSTMKEYKIPLSAVGLAQGMSIKVEFKAFGNNRFPATGFASLSLEAEKCHMERVYNQIEANCERTSLDKSPVDEGCNARILEEKITVFNPAMMAYYLCTFTVETPTSMQGEYFVDPEAEDLDGLKTPADENEFWFLNPEIAIGIDGSIDFGTIRPGATGYSDTILVTNNAESGSGVFLDMYIAGTDFYDPSSSGAKCPTTNQLALTNFAYFATNGAYSTANSGCPADPQGEGYASIPSGNRIGQSQEIIGCQPFAIAPLGGGIEQYQPGNVLSPGADISLTFRLNLPEPCNGDFTEGSILFWGEAV
ncbi:MAG: hypothetical protein V1837_06485 [Candidatus Woesearchaeota archaeon]